MRLSHVVVLFALLAFPSLGCSPPGQSDVFPTGANCSPGATLACTCSDGRPSEHACLPEQVFAPCRCESQPSEGGAPAIIGSGGTGGTGNPLPLAGAPADPASGGTANPMDTPASGAAGAAGGEEPAPVPLRGAPDPRDAVIYQVNLRAFSNEGFRGVTARLDQIQALGINVVYLMPVTPVGTVNSVNSPFCVRHYTEVNPEFGSLEELRALIAAAHDRGMAVILDWVANHTAWDHSWITEHPDWYERDDTGAIRPASVNGFVWEDVAQLNFNNQDMRAAMLEAMQYWVTTVDSDGFRFDFADGPPVDFWIEATDRLRADNEKQLILYAEGGSQENYQAFDYNHGFSFYDALLQMFGPSQAPATRVENENDAQYRDASADNRLVRYITNHDVNGWDGVPQGLLGGQAGAMAAFVIAAYNRGVPLIYNGQEIALDYPLTFPFTEETIQWTPNPTVTDEYTRVIGFYNRSTAIRRGMPTAFSTNDVSAFVKQSDGEQALIIVNTRNRSVTYPVHANLMGVTWYNAFDGAEIDLPSALELAPYQYLALSSVPLP